MNVLTNLYNRVIDPTTWIHGLSCALIIGFSSAAYAYFQHPNISHNEILFLALGGTFLYLQKSPLPDQPKGK